MPDVLILNSNHIHYQQLAGGLIGAIVVRVVQLLSLPVSFFCAASIDYDDLTIEQLDLGWGRICYKKRNDILL